MDFRTVCGIVIGPKQVNYVLLQRRKNNVLLLAAAFYEFSFDRQDEFKDIVASIEGFLPKNTLTNISVIHPETIEHLFLYDSNVANVRANIYRDLKNSYEINLSDYLIDYEEFEVSGKKVAFVNALPKYVFDLFYTAFKDHKKLCLFSLETPVVSLRRVVNEFCRKYADVLVFNMCDEFSRIFTLKRYNIIVNRQVQGGFSSILKDMEREGGITEEEAKKLIYDRGFSDKDLDDEQKKAFYMSLSESFDRFSIEIQRTLDYLISVQKMGGVESICTLGFASSIKNVDKYLSKMFSMKAESLKLKKEIEFADEVDFSIVEDMLYFDICIGAALRRVG